MDATTTIQRLYTAITNFRSTPDHKPEILTTIALNALDRRRSPLVSTMPIDKLQTLFPTGVIIPNLGPYRFYDVNLSTASPEIKPEAVLSPTTVKTSTSFSQFTTESVSTGSTTPIEWEGSEDINVGVTNDDDRDSSTFNSRDSSGSIFSTSSRKGSEEWPHFTPIDEGDFTK